MEEILEKVEKYINKLDRNECGTLYIKVARGEDEIYLNSISIEIENF